MLKTLYFHNQEPRATTTATITIQLEPACTVYDPEDWLGLFSFGFPLEIGIRAV
jgi:hypothetical protein